MSASSPSTPDGEPWTAEYGSNNGRNGRRVNDRPPNAQRRVVLGYITAVAMPPIGLVIGITLVIRPARAGSKHGLWIIGLSIIASILWILIINSGWLTDTSNDVSY